jgi:hypothetical protein
MKLFDTFVRHKTDGTTYTQTSFSGKLRWFYKPLYDEPTLQQEQVVRHIENYVTTRIETNWIDVPITY